MTALGPEPLSLTPESPTDAAEIQRLLDEGRDLHWEHPVLARANAVRCQEVARFLGRPGLRARALCVLGTISLNRGDMRGAFTLAGEAEREAAADADAAAFIEVAALKAQLSFFSGSYAEALQEGGTTVALADRSGDPRLRIFARRAACLVMGNLDAPGWRDELDELIRLSAEVGDAWQEAISRNDLGHWLMTRDDLDGAARELERGLELLEPLAPHNALALAVVHCTRAELRLRADDAVGALADAERALELLAGFDEPNPYLFGMTVKLEVQALLALGRPDDAERCGARAVERLGDRVPQARSLILESVATALRSAGRTEEAYDTLARGAELERKALQELTELQIGLERATLETKAARHEADALALKNRELENAHAELQERTAQLEALQEELREQADRDALTGLHNRRFLMSRFDQLATEVGPDPISLAIVDLDNFKAINDALGHVVGDRVLIRAAALLQAGIRPHDVLARTGGEEFVLVMPRTDAAAAVAVCERVLDALRTETWRRIGTGLNVTASIGVATAAAPPGERVNLETLTTLADERLYVAKRDGRDRLASR